MRPRIRVIAGTVALACAFATLVTAPTLAGASGPGALQTTGSGLRGQFEEVTATGLEPTSTYTLSADSGGFRDTLGSTSSVVTDSDGNFYISYQINQQTPFTTRSVHLIATGPDGQSVATDVALVAPTSLGKSDYYARACPGRQVTVHAVGFPDGAYAVTSPYFATASSATAANGDLTLTGTIADTAPAQIPVTVTAPDGQHTRIDLTVHRDAPFATDALDSNPPWTRRWTADCFAPGERVDFRALDTSSLAPPSADADSQGRIDVRVGGVGQPQRSSPAGARATGARSAQTATLWGPDLYGTTLYIGQSLTPSSSATPVLRSASGRFQAQQSYCGLDVFGFDEGGGGRVVWELPLRSDPNHQCRLALRPDGNMVIYADDGHWVWQSHTAGTGAFNRLIMRNNGDLTLYTASWRPVWSGHYGVIRTSYAMVTNQVLYRGQWLHYGSTWFGLRPSGDVGVYRSGHQIWSAHTAGKGGYALRLDPTGALTLRTKGGHRLWSSPWKTSSSIMHLGVSYSGDVQIRDQYGVLMWHTRT